MSKYVRKVYAMAQIEILTPMSPVDAERAKQKIVEAMNKALEYSMKEVAKQGCAEQAVSDPMQIAVNALKGIEWSNDSKWQSDCAKQALAALSQVRAKAQEPVGYKLVPVKATKEMKDAYTAKYGYPSYGAGHEYAFMVAAAPQSDAQQSERPDDATTIERGDADMLIDAHNTILWLERRLSPGYGNVPHVQRTLAALDKAIVAALAKESK